MRFAKTAAFGIIFIACISSHADHKVYLIHGFGSAPVFMRSMERFLTKHKLETVNFGYHSLTTDLVVCGENLYVDIKKRNIDTVSFVTHSMGALVLRSIIGKIEGDSSFPEINRIVMIAPPNHGAELADILASSTILRYVLGPNLQHLVTDSSSLANHLPVPEKYEIGIIIGIKKGKKGYNPFIKGNNDGYLTPQSALLGTEKESIYVSAEHSMIIHNKKVFSLVYNFIINGKFKNDLWAPL